MNPVIGIAKHPTWAGCQEVQRTDDSECPRCGVIYNACKPWFSDNYYDLLYNMSLRYPSVQFWSLWNEPNLDHNFSPQNPLRDGYLWNEYMYLIGQPGYRAVKANIPTAKIIGVELATCDNGGDACTYVDNNWFYHTKWNSGWMWSLYGFWYDWFDLVSIHNYSPDDWGVRTMIGNLWNSTMVYWYNQNPTQYPFKWIWTTEANFKKGTCDVPMPDLTYRHCSLYKQMSGYWERSFYFNHSTGEANCGFGMLGRPSLGYPLVQPLYDVLTRVFAANYSDCP